MFAWYKQSSVCYAYLIDVEKHADRVKLDSELANARWFTRGWTLQELLAPQELVLYSRSWERLGTKSEFCTTLSKITGIQAQFLRGQSLAQASISRRMSWAAKRTTSRTEDIAYCLLGLFDVQIPLLYGEGTRAFRRLQEEILNANPTDHTLFAWGRQVHCPERQVIEPLILEGVDPIPWNEAEAGKKLRGLLADSPRDFRFSANFSPWRGTEAVYGPHLNKLRYPTLAGASILIELPVLPSESFAAHHWSNPKLGQLRPILYAVLLCEDMGSPTPSILLPLYPWGHSRLGRTDGFMIRPYLLDAEECLKRGRYLQVQPEPGSNRNNLNPGDFLIRRWDLTRALEVEYGTYNKQTLSISSEGIFTAPPNPSIRGRLWSLDCRLTPTEHRRGFRLSFGRRIRKRDPWGLGPIYVSVVAILLGGDGPEGEKAPAKIVDGRTWVPGTDMVIGGKYMNLPQDTWELDMEPFPLMEVRVTRTSIGPKPGNTIDVVDIKISDRLNSVVEASRKDPATDELIPVMKPKRLHEFSLEATESGEHGVPHLQGVGFKFSK